MYKKIFGIVLILHIVAFAYLGLRSGNSELIPPQDDAETLSRANSKEGSSPSLIKEDPLTEISPTSVPFAVIDFDYSDSQSLPQYISSEDLTTGMVVEVPSGRVLWSKDSERPVEIASMTKMMTALLAFEDIEARSDLTLDTEIQVTTAAFRIGGSQVWLDPRESFSLQELLISIMVKSANDSAYLVGEYLAGGNMDRFIERMNQRATELKMKSTLFLNAHGLPEGDTGNTASCEDLAHLASALLRFDKAVEWASLPDFTFRADADEPTILTNHNRLLLTTDGVDGLKTGYTKRAGYCITATCLRNDRRLIAVATGFKSSKRRDTFVKELLDWAYTL